MRTLKKIICWVIKKKKGRVYAIPHNNCKNDKIDLVNFTSSNLLCFINTLIRIKDTSHDIYLECYDSARIGIIQEYLDKNGAVNIHLVPSSREDEISRFECLKRKMRSYLYSCSSSELWSETGNHFDYKSKNQRCVCFNYFVPFKNDYFTNNHWWKDIDYLMSTSKLCAQIISISTSIPFEKIHYHGFPRCEYLLNGERRITRAILDEMYGCTGKQIIIYAPTYRHNSNSKSDIFGYGNDDLIIENLRKNNFFVILKKHPLDKSVVLTNSADTIKEYLPNYNYTIYDIMPLAASMISDYSSIALEYGCLCGNIIYNWYDSETYLSDRGVSYSPIEKFVNGVIVKNANELVQAIQNISVNLENEMNELLFGSDLRNSCALYLEDMKNGWPDVMYYNIENA